MQFAIKKKSAVFWSSDNSLQDIREMLSKGRIAEDWLVCPQGEANRAVLVSELIARPDLFEPMAPVVSLGTDDVAEQEQSPLAFLDAVRRRTCYSALREMIGIGAALSIIGIVILAALEVALGLQNHVIVIVVGVLGCFLVIASTQASLLLIDIADTLIEQNRKKRV